MPVEETGVQTAAKLILPFWSRMGSAISRHAAIRQSETGFLPYRLFYVTARGNPVYLSMPVAES